MQNFKLALMTVALSMSMGALTSLAQADPLATATGRTAGSDYDTQDLLTPAPPVQLQRQPEPLWANNNPAPAPASNYSYEAAAPNAGYGAPTPSYGTPAPAPAPQSGNARTGMATPVTGVAATGTAAGMSAPGMNVTDTAAGMSAPGMNAMSQNAPVASLSAEGRVDSGVVASQIQDSQAASSANQEILEAQSNVQEVSVTALSSFDQAIMEGFKSLESGLTLGMSQSKPMTLDEVAPALRSFTSDADGNLVLRFSVPMVEHILKKQGAVSWQGLSNPVLVWLVGFDGSSDASSLSLISGQSLTPFAQNLLAAAPDYKYRLMFPILDLEDMNKVKVSTVLDHQDKALAQASARYGADFFIAASLSSVPNENELTLKWNLYNKDGLLIAQSSLSGVMDEVTSLGSGDIARALMTYQSNLLTKDSPTALREDNVDIDMIGPGQGFVRLRISNVRSLQDIAKIRKAFVTYGFDGNVRVVGYDNGQMVIEISTNSDPSNLEGTMQHASEFQYLAPWTFALRQNVSARPLYMEKIGKASAARPNSQIKPHENIVTRLPRKQWNEVGQGPGLPTRQGPTIQGTSY